MAGSFFIGAVYFRRYIFGGKLSWLYILFDGIADRPQGLAVVVFHFKPRLDQIGIWMIPISNKQAQ